MANPVRTIDGTSTYIYAPTDPTDFLITNGGSLDLGGVINPADVITVATSNSNAISSLKIDDVRDSGETIIFNDGVINLDGLRGTTVSGSTYSDVDAWSLQNGVLSLTSKGQTVARYNFTDASPEAGKTANIEISQFGTGTYITEGTLGQPASATLLPGNLAQPQPQPPVMPPLVVIPPVTPPTTTQNPPATTPIQPAVNPPVIISDGTTGQPITTIAAQPYTGPVAGIIQQVIAVTAQNLNILATAPNLFIHTGSGTDAIQAAEGTNVLDGGTGSNFLTAGTGTDTFFVDARGAATDTWSTVAKFHAGDAATLWGVSAATAGQWADGQGAAGATGLTLHAGAAGGPTASITLAGFTTADLRNGRLVASFGRDAASGSEYLYMRAG